MKRNLRTIYFYSGMIDQTNLCTQFGNNCKKHIRITDVRHILNAAYSIHQECRRNHRNGGIFSSADFNLSF